MNHLDYKIYSWDWSSYTDISDDVKDISNIPILAINPDQSPVFEGVTLKSIVDMTETGNEYLSVGKYIAVEIDGHKRYYGVVKSSYFDYDSQLWNYSVNHYFQKLKDDTPTELSFYIQLYMSTPDVVEIATDLPAGYIDGNNVWQPDTLTYFEITIKGFLKAMIEGPGFLNMTAVFDLDTDKTTLLESFKISHKNLESWKSNYADYELEYNLYNMLDILVVILKIFGLKMYFSDTETITVSGNDTAPTFDTFTPADVNSYSKREKESEMLKQIYLQQKEFLIKDIIDPKNPDYYFSVGVLFSYNRVLDMIDSGDDLELTFALDHKLPTANNTMFTKLKMLGYNEGEIDQEQEEWSISDTDKIKLTGKALTEMRYSQTNVGDEFTLDSATITHAIANIAYSTIVATDIGLSLETLSITGCFTWFMLAFVQGSYTYETGSGNPSGAGKYRVQDDDTIIICKGGVSSQPQVANYLIENEGTAIESLGISGTPKYIQYTSRTTMSGTDVIAIHFSSAGHGVVNTDDVRFVGTNGIDGSYNYMAGVAPITGEYYIFSSTVLYILDEGQDIDDYCDVRVWNEDKTIEKQLTTQGRQTEKTTLYDYLTIYRPSYAGLTGWKSDWKTISLQDTVYTLLLNATLYAPWWFYYFSQYYQRVYSESINVDDSVTPDLEKSRKISYNIDDYSIGIEQDDV